jgi:DNA-3-methyladenine glycosylase
MTNRPSRCGPIDASWCQRDALEIAPDLIGCDLTMGDRVARIVEVEAYRQHDDEASHTFRGRTTRNSAMFLPGGHWYVYFTYGMHWCVNLVTGPRDDGQAVLIRAAEVVSGLDSFRRTRPTSSDRDLLRGPARLTQGFAIEAAINATSAVDGPLHLVPPHQSIRPTLMSGPRIGIRNSIDLPWRWWEQGNPHVSGSAAANERSGTHYEPPKSIGQTDTDV